MEGRHIGRGAFGVLALSALLCGLSGSIQALQSVPAGSIGAHWPMDTITAGTSTPDVTVNANTANFVSTPVATSGVFGAGLLFDGTADSLTVPATASLDPGSNSYTVAMWIKPANVTALMRMYNKWNTAGNGSGILMDINAGPTGTTVGGNVRFRISDGTDNLDYAAAGGLVANVWQHIAGTVDRTAGQLRIFVNGFQIGTTQTILPAVGAATVVDEVQIGELNAAGRYSGVLDEVVFYQRALAPSEISQMYFQGFAAIGVGNAAPVVSQHGLLGQYYNNNATIDATMTPPGSPNATISTTATLNLTRFDPIVNFDWGTATQPAGINADDFFVVWTGKLTTTPGAGNYSFGSIADDGTRIWVNNTLVFDNWFAQPPPGTPQMGAATALAADTTYDIRVEFFERGGGAVMRLYWQPPGAAAPELLSPAYVKPPDGPAAPTGVTATASTSSTTPSVAVTWNASVAPPIDATSYIVSRATTSGGPYTQVAVQTGTTFNDTGVVFGTTYYYIVQGTAVTASLVGPASAESGGATPVPPPISVTPTSGLVTLEGGLTDTITLRVEISPTGTDANVLLSASPEARLSTGALPTASVNVTIPIGTPVGTPFPVTVSAFDDAVADGPQPITITLTLTGGGYTSPPPMPSVTGTANDNDTPGIVVTQLLGPTSENGPPGTTFSVVFTSEPTTTTTVTVVSNNTGEGTVSPGTLTFDNTTFPSATGWNTSHVVTVTGVDDSVLDFTQAYSISLTVSGGDPTYVAMTSGGPIVRNAINLDNETIPELDPVWGGGGGGGGGCGLLGLEFGVVVALAALRRRRRTC